jgi:hypothetical protein
MLAGIPVDAKLSVTIMLRMLSGTTFIDMLVAFAPIATLGLLETTVEVLEVQQQVIFKAAAGERNVHLLAVHLSICFLYSLFV